MTPIESANGRYLIYLLHLLTLYLVIAYYAVGDYFGGDIPSPYI
jgi:hypothetical protein